MLSKIPFYHSTTKKMVVAVGALFSNLFCVTKNGDGVTQKIVTVPLAYLNKEKFILRLQQDPKSANAVEITLPRLSYEIVGFDYDSSRQLNKVNKINGVRDDKNIYSFSPVPYNITFNVYSYTRTMEDNLQIMEQIVPYFTPDLSLSIKIMQNPDVTQNCPLTLTSVNTDDQYDGAFEDRRFIITTYAFTLKMHYYGPIFGNTDPENHFESGDAVSVIKKVTVNLNTNKYTAVIDPFDASATDPYEIQEGWGERTPENDFDQDRKL